MKTDRELLELAAKAAGLSGYIHEWINGPEFIVPGENPVTWNPLADDGDALRLAVKLRISVMLAENATDTPECVFVNNGDWLYAQVDGGDSADIATRRAIVMAAATIGESMP